VHRNRQTTPKETVCIVQQASLICAALLSRFCHAAAFAFHSGSSGAHSAPVRPTQTINQASKAASWQNQLPANYAAHGRVSAGLPAHRAASRCPIVVNEHSASLQKRRTALRFDGSGGAVRRLAQVSSYRACASDCAPSFQHHRTNNRKGTSRQT